MSSNLQTRALALALAFAGAGMAADAHAGLSVCVDTSSPGADMDRKVAEAIAHDQGTALAVHEFDGEGDDEGFNLKNFNKLAGERCQLVLGFPIGDSASGLPEGLKATLPYGRTGFVLVTPVSGQSHTLATLASGDKVAVTYQTTPNLYFVHYPKLQADIRLTNDDAIDALEKGSVQAAMLWRPTVVKYLGQHGTAQRFEYAELDEPNARYNLVALYLESNAAAAKAFEDSVARLRSSGALTRLLQPYAVVAEAAQKQAAVVRRAPAASSLLAAEVRRSHSLVARAQRGSMLAAGGVAAKPSAKPAQPVVVANAAAAPSGPRPTLFTEEQAASGKALYAQQCALCHGDTLDGRAGPALKGKHFAPADGKFKVGDIFTIVAKNMPATQPASLPHDTYADIMAYLLQQNGFPSGKSKLTYDAAKASQVPLIYGAAK